MGRTRKSDQNKEGPSKVRTAVLRSNALITMSNRRFLALQPQAQDKERASHNKSKVCPENVFQTIISK